MSAHHFYLLYALKSDAIPGRLNATGLIINRPSSFYGQCSELCGVLHGFMPIGLHAVNIPSWFYTALKISFSGPPLTPWRHHGPYLTPGGGGEG